MKKKKVFKWAYLIFLAVMISLVVAASLYVYNMLTEYENSQPQYRIEEVISQLKADAVDPQKFWNKYGLAEVVSSEFEKNTDLKIKYLNQYLSDDINFVTKNSIGNEDEIIYNIRDGKNVLAEVTLKAQGDVKTELAVFSWRDWSVDSIKPIFESNDYEINLPEEFTLSVNGITVPLENGEEIEGKIKYAVNGIYFQPEFKITDANGEEAKFAIKNNKVLTEYYDYTLTLPYTLSVNVNGEKSNGVELANGNIRHDIMLLEKPEVIISDLYGNNVTYEGEELPLTYMTVIAESTNTVKLNGESIAESAIKTTDIAEYDILAAILENVPKQCEYNIAILKNDAKITYSTPSTSEITLDNEIKKHNLIDFSKSDNNVPDEITSVTDVLAVAQNWSLFMSNDYDFVDLANLMLKDSYQYEVARKYNTSIDKTLFSEHTLCSPAFTDSKVENFKWITDDSFSVDVSFIKHMRLVTGRYVDDAMNDRFYFVNSNGKWLLAGLKEVSEDVE